MPIHSNIFDPRTSNSATVTEDKALLTINEGLPPFNVNQRGYVYRQFFSTSSGVTNMNVNASSTVPQEFSVRAIQSGLFDTYISCISFRVQDGSMKMSDFGGLSALTNGVDIEYVNPNVSVNGTVSLSLSSLKTNLDLIRLCNVNPPLSNNFTTDITGVESAYLPVLDFRQYGLKYGILLRAGTTDRITIRIKDDLTGITIFDAIANGFQRAK